MIIGSISGVSPTATERPNRQRFHPVVLGEPDDKKHGRHHHDHEADHEPDKGFDTLVEIGRHFDLGSITRDCPKNGVAAAQHHDAACCTAHHRAPLKTGVG